MIKLDINDFIQYLRQCESKTNYFVDMKCAFYKNEEIFLICEYLPGPSLRSLIDENGFIHEEHAKIY